jgi:hypothetical protein
VLLRRKTACNTCFRLIIPFFCQHVHALQYLALAHVIFGGSVPAYTQYQQAIPWFAYLELARGGFPSAQQRAWDS